MYTLYNDFDNISTLLADYFFNCSNNISKPQAFNLAYITLGASLSNSVLSSNVSLEFKGNLSFNKPDSNEKRVKRFFNNSSIDMYQFYPDFITSVINNYKVKHNDNNVFICFDHSYNKDNYTSLVFTLVIGKQAAPIWFKCFKGLHDKDAFSINTIKDGILFVHNLFKDFNIIFLADRWFNDPAIFKFIDDLNDKFCIRTKTNVYISKDHNSFVSLSDVKPRKHKSKLLNNVLFTKTQELNINIAISPSKSTDDPWYIVTNLDPKLALKYYHKRFGGIEFFFKSQKSNGFNLEKTTVSNLLAFKNMFACTCVTVVWLTILGSDYVKNKSHSQFNLYDTRKTNNKIIRVKSLFRIGLQILKYVYNSRANYNLKTNFILYDL